MGSTSSVTLLLPLNLDPHFEIHDPFASSSIALPPPFRAVPALTHCYPPLFTPRSCPSRTSGSVLALLPPGILDVIPSPSWAPLPTHRTCCTLEMPLGSPTLPCLSSVPFPPTPLLELRCRGPSVCLLPVSDFARICHSEPFLSFSPYCLPALPIPRLRSCCAPNLLAFRLCPSMKQPPPPFLTLQLSHFCHLLL